MGLEKYKELSTYIADLNEKIEKLKKAKDILDKIDTFLSDMEENLGDGFAEIEREYGLVNNLWDAFFGSVNTIDSYIDFYGRAKENIIYEISREVNRK